MAERQASKWVGGLAGAVASIALHLMLLSPWLLGSGHKAPPIRTNDEGVPSSGAAAMTVVFLNAAETRSDPAEDQNLAREAALTTQLPVLAPIGAVNKGLGEVSFAFEPDAVDSYRDTNADAPGDQEGRAALFGRYLGQIIARISRAWLRPRSPIGSETFSCWVQVDQDRHGTVLQITLKRCNSTPSWQISLVHAIESSSPLPAPPDSRVFTQTLTFEMSSHGFDPVGPADGFEPDGSTSARPAEIETSPSPIQR